MPFDTPSSTPVYRTAHQRVLEVLGLEVVSGATPPGSTFEPEPVLCARLGVSRGALREGMKALAAKGMVEVRPRTGTRVLPQERWNLLDRRVLSWLRQVDPDRLIVHLTEVREMIEPGAAELAALQADEAARQELLKAYDAMEASSHANRHDDFNRADIAFHLVLLRMGRNPLLAALSTSLQVALELSFATTSTAPGALTTTLPIHRHIALAVCAHDAGRARDLMRTLICTSAQHFAEVRDGHRRRS
jgi:DNA-binding FadR family transcriptional regulator